MMTRCSHSLAFRLTLWYAGVFGLCFLTVFATFYVMMRHQFHHWSEAELRGEMTEVGIAYKNGRLEGVVRQLVQEEASEGGRFMARLINPRGTITFETGPGQWARAHVKEDALKEARSGKQLMELMELDEKHTVQVLYAPLPDGSVVQIGLILFDHEIWLTRFSEELLKVALLALILSVSAGWFMARRALSPIQEMAHTASSISGKSLGQRVPVPGWGDEVDQLAEAFNGMLDRIDVLVQGLREVTDTLAHDLRTPMTGIRGIAEVALRSNREPEAYRLVLCQIIEQMDRLLALSSSILDVAEAESGALPLDWETISIGDLAEKIVQTFQPVALDKGVELETSIPGELKVRCDRARLGQVFANLLDNAIKYTPTGGHIRLLVEHSFANQGADITVTDTGSGISQEDLPHIFERYYRGDKSRSGAGVGLGLPLVQGIVKAHGGRVFVESKPGEGSVFRVFLPFNFEA